MAVAIPTLDLDHPSTPLPDRLSARPDFPSMYVVDEEVDALVRDLSRERTHTGLAIVGAAARSLVCAERRDRQRQRGHASVAACDVRVDAMLKRIMARTKCPRLYAVLSASLSLCLAERRGRFYLMLESANHA